MAHPGLPLESPLARSKFGAPMFEPKAFGSKCAVFKKVLVTLLGLTGAPAVIRRAEKCTLLVPLVTRLPTTASAPLIFSISTQQ